LESPTSDEGSLSKAKILNYGGRLAVRRRKKLKKKLKK